MKKEYDFSKGKRGAVVPAPKGKTRITIRIDDDILDWFRGEVEAAGGGNYQTLINQALREYLNQQQQPLEELLRRVVREELHSVSQETKPEPLEVVRLRMFCEISIFGGNRSFRDSLSTFTVAPSVLRTSPPNTTMKIESLNRRIWGRLRDGHFPANTTLSILHHSKFILALLAGEGIIRAGVEDCPLWE